MPWRLKTVKNMVIDIVKIREKIGEDICPFGNIDPIKIVHKGTPEVIKEVKKQLTLKPEAKASVLL